MCWWWKVGECNLFSTKEMDGWRCQLPFLLGVWVVWIATEHLSSILWRGQTIQIRLCVNEMLKTQQSGQQPKLLLRLLYCVQKPHCRSALRHSPTPPPAELRLNVFPRPGLIFRVLPRGFEVENGNATNAVQPVPFHKAEMPAPDPHPKTATHHKEQHGDFIYRP